MQIQPDSLFDMALQNLESTPLEILDTIHFSVAV